MIINLRGPNGSGKSTIARKFIQLMNKNLDNLTTMSGEFDTQVYYGKLPNNDSMTIIGSYQNTCGGMDTIKTQAQAREAVELASNLSDHVLFEGILISTIYKPWLDVARNLKHQQFIWAYLTDSLNTCVDRILDRNSGKPFSIPTLQDKFTSINSTMRKAIDDGEYVVCERSGDMFDRLQKEIYHG